ncbi:hypothetical protein EDD16DRAFT_1519705 [Pisolithus croceorrhizus]|nr:hypothetical protein EV401DRAFT_1890960 [Pisolithus croceorrhizus]KAI6118683.1 hypothetical protein EDD16DRAFT_1519705 [Pisolithus croceorrhizus]
MSNHSFCLTPRMINEEALYLLSQYAMHVITLEVAMDKIKYILQYNFDEEEWMAIMHCSLFLDLPNPAGPSLKDPSILGMPDSATEDHNNEDIFSVPPKLSGFSAQRSRYIHAEWQPLINAIFALSDPSNEDLQPPSSPVEGAMWAHRVSFATPPGLLPTIPTSPHNPSWSATQCPSGKTPWKLKCQKMGISMFLDVAAEEDDEDEDEDEEFSKAQKSAGHLVDVGPSGKSSFSQAIDSMMVRYDRVPQYRGTRVQRLLEGVPLPSMKNVYIVDLFSESAQSFVYEYMKSKGVDITFLPWLPCRLYMAQQVLPILTWVHIKKGLYKGDIGFIETSNAIDVVLVIAPCLGLEPILSPTGVGIGFTFGGHDFIHGLLHLTVPAHSVTLVELPHPDNIAFHMITHFERSSVVKAVQLFSAQFWQELDMVKICEGELHGSQGSLINVEWDK